MKVVAIKYILIETSLEPILERWSWKYFSTQQSFPSSVDEEVIFATKSWNHDEQFIFLAKTENSTKDGHCTETRYCRTSIKRRHFKAVVQTNRSRKLWVKKLHFHKFQLEIKSNSNSILLEQRLSPGNATIPLTQLSIQIRVKRVILAYEEAGSKLFFVSLLLEAWCKNLSKLLRYWLLQSATQILLSS